MISREVALEMEPEVDCVGALLSPSTGVVDSHALMLAYQGDAEDAGGCIAFNTAVLGGSVTDEGIVLQAEGAGELLCDIVVNTAGLDAPILAAGITGLHNHSAIPTGYFAKGNYYKLEGQRTPFNRLIYPVPDPNTAGLGVHATIDIGGACRFGPDVEWVEDGSNYDVDPARSDVFYKEVRKYWPGLKDGALVADYSGIRPKLSAAGEMAADFTVLGPAEHNAKGLYHMLGIESPGLTSSLALADHIDHLIKAEFA